VPILGPVEHNEPLYLREAARKALLTHGAARNFRNIWYHYQDDFAAFRKLIRETWPGMDIEPPEVDRSHNPPLLRMFCPEERIPREIYWAGFGFQVWCQMLTHIVRNVQASIFLIDEPDIYLHSDIQRQLLAILKDLGPDILIATHSTELIAEAEPDELLVINKLRASAKRIKEPGQVQTIFKSLGSNINPVLTQLAKTKRALFVEGSDFQLLSRFARKLGKSRVANRSDFAVVPVDGFNPGKVRSLKEGIELTLGGPVSAAAIFDRDYRSEDEVIDQEEILAPHCVFARIHGRKELENYLLVPVALEGAIRRRIDQQNSRTGKDTKFDQDAAELLRQATESLRLRVQAQYMAHRRDHEKRKGPHRDEATIVEGLIEEFDAIWQDNEKRMKIVPGKEVLAALNGVLQDEYDVTVSSAAIINECPAEEIPEEMVTLIEEIEAFAQVRTT
jgi:hypothetical protein